MFRRRKPVDKPVDSAGALTIHWPSASYPAQITPSEMHAILAAMIREDPKRDAWLVAEGIYCFMCKACGSWIDTDSPWTTEEWGKDHAWLRTVHGCS
jgi:hypothetical protein